MVSSLIFGALIFANQSAKVSLELRGVRLENAAPAIAKTLGFDSLAIGPTLTNDILLLRCKDVDPAVLQAQIAKALNATWEHREEGWRLYQTDIQKDAEKKIYEQKKREYYVDLVKRARARIAKMAAFDDKFCADLKKDTDWLEKEMASDDQSRRSWARWASIEARSPKNRLALRMASRITPEMFDSLSTDRPRILFCTRPTPMQQAFPFRLDDIVASAIDEQRRWSTYLAANTPPPAGQDDDDMDLPRRGGMDDSRPYAADDFTTVTMDLSLDAYSINITAYGKNGRQTLSTYFTLVDEEEAADEQTSQVLSRAAMLEERKKKAVKLEGDALEYATIVAPINWSSPKGPDQKELSPSLLQKVLNPETIDPLSITAAEVYAQSVAQPNYAIVLTDNNFSDRRADFMDIDWAKDRDTGYTRDGDWLIFHPVEALETRRNQVDRKKLGAVLRFMNKNRRPLTLEEWANLVFTMPWEAESLWAFMAMVQPLKTAEIEPPSDPAPLRIYGSLSESQRSDARKQGIPLQNLSDATQKEIYRAIFCTRNGRTNLQMDEPDEQENLSEEAQKKLDDFQAMVWGGLYQEPTFVLPNGLTNKCSLSIEESSSPGLYCKVQPSRAEEWYRDGYQITDPDTLGASMFHQTKPERYGRSRGESEVFDTSSIQIVSTRSITIKVMIAPKLCYTWNIGQTTLSDPKEYSAKTLPKEIRDQIEKAYKEAEEQDKEYGNFIPAATPKKVPPPRI